MKFLRSILHSPRTLHRMGVMLLWNCAVYYGGRLLSGGTFHRDFTTELDGRIPFLPWTVSVYFLAFLFWSANYVLALTREDRAAEHFFRADVLSRTVALSVFLLCPTTMTRPELSGSGFWDGLMRLLYAVDEPNVLFPSFHCLNSALSCFGIWRDERVSAGYKVFSVLAALAICLSTLTTRQHVLWDVFAGVGLGAVCYALSSVGLDRHSLIRSGR
ncbi:MAG: phosphatase PAP2 family protein [Oscillospiraceae bacterium]|nr:phosphatase PAP2 family protein [Oscillospiraceae bacterium]